MAAQVRMGVRFGWWRGVDRRAGLGPAAAGDRVAALWFGWRDYLLSQLLPARDGAGGERRFLSLAWINSGLSG